MTSDTRSPAEKLLARNISYHTLTRFSIALFVAITQVLFSATMPSPRSPWIFVVIGSIVVSAFSFLFYLRIEPSGNEALDLKAFPRCETFPLHALLWDFINLTVLVLLTGGSTSMFLPLYVIGLLISDVCLEDSRDRRIILLIFVVTTTAGLFLPEIELIRCFFISQGEIPCAHSIWQLNSFSQNISVWVVFIVGTFLSSIVLRRYIDYNIKMGNDQ